LALPNIHDQTIHLGPLERGEAISFLKRVGVQNERHIDMLLARCGHHALSLRIVAEHIRIHGEVDPARISGRPILEPKDLFGMDARDMLRGNKLAGIMSFVLGSISEELSGALEIIAVACPRKVPRAFIHSLLSERGIASPRDLIAGLARRWLINCDSEGIYLHRLVYEYFELTLPRERRRDLHRAVLALYQRSVDPDVVPDSPASLARVSAMCIHAARAEVPETFHYWFFHVLNRGLLKYYAYVYGAWDDMLDLVTLVFDGGDLTGEPLIRPSYYHGIAASCLRRVGRNREATRHYLASISATLDPGDHFDLEAAMQLNCFAAQSIGMGRLDLAGRLLALNFPACHWIDDFDSRLWQTEHALITLGRWFFVTGRFDRARHCFEHAADLREVEGYDYRAHHSLERLWEVDLLLLEDRVDQASGEARVILEEARHQGYGDIEAAAMRALARIVRLSGTRLETSPVRTSREWTDRALEMIHNRLNEEVEIQILIEWLLVRADALGSGDCKMNMAHLSRLIERSGMDFYRSWLLLLEAMDRDLAGQRQSARSRLDRAILHARGLGSAAFLESKELAMALTMPGSEDLMVGADFAPVAVPAVLSLPISDLLDLRMRKDEVAVVLDHLDIEYLVGNTGVGGLG
jgi:hypothetical protein